MEATKLVRAVGREEGSKERRGEEVVVVKEGGSPTAEFLQEMKEKMELLTKEQMEIEDRFEDYNQTSLQE